MDQKWKESASERVTTKEREFEDDCYVQLVLFTAGIAVLMACFKRVLIMAFLLEEWRAWVFLFLNLVLLAILITSTFSITPKESKDCDVEESKKAERNEKIKRRSSKCCSESEPVVSQREDNKLEDYCQKKIVCRGLLQAKNGVGGDEASCREDDQMEAPRLSKEELNERAEAFIVMFRQHLVLDARKCGKR